MNRLIDLIKQLLKYESTAIICGVIDYGLLILLVEIFHIHYFWASLAALLTAMVVQYLLNFRFVFETAQKHQIRKFIGYAILGCIGIGLNQLIVYLAVSRVGLHYLGGKICSSVLVGIYNFTSRKLYLENIDRLGANARNRRAQTPWKMWEEKDYE